MDELLLNDEEESEVVHYQEQEQSYEDEDYQVGLYLDDDEDEVSSNIQLTCQSCLTKYLLQVCPPTKHRKHDDSDHEFLAASRTASFFTAKEDDDEVEVNDDDDADEPVLLEDESPQEIRTSDLVLSSCGFGNFGSDSYNSNPTRRKSGVEDITAHLMNLFAGQSSFVL